MNYFFSEQKRQLRAQKKAEEKAQRRAIVQDTSGEASSENGNDDQELDPHVSLDFVLIIRLQSFKSQYFISLGIS